MCTVLTATKPFLGTAAHASTQIVPYDERRLALVINVDGTAIVGGSAALTIVAAIDTSGVTADIGGTMDIDNIDGDVNIGSIPTTGNVDPVTGNVSESSAFGDPPIHLAGPGVTSALTANFGGTPSPITGTVSGGVGASAVPAGYLKRNPADPGIPLYAGTEVLQLSRDDYYDLLNGPFYWDDNGSGATIKGYDVTQIGPDSPRERT